MARIKCSRFYKRNVWSGLPAVPLVISFTSARFVWASNQEAEMNVRYRVELSQAERDELTAMLSAGKHAARRGPACLAQVSLTVRAPTAPGISPPIRFPAVGSICAVQ